MRTKILLSCILVQMITLQLSGQGFLSTNGKAIINESSDTVLLRGMGLGGWMLQEGYMMQTSSFANAQYQLRGKIEELIGSADADLFYETWRANHVRKIDIDSLKAWGFNSVRLPMHYNLYTLPVEDEPVAGQHTWIDTGFDLTDSLISWCKQNQMYVILDLHAAPGGQGYESSISDYDPTKPSLWESKANRNKTVALWKKLAERYVDEPTVAGYDLINETNWNMSGNTPLRNLLYEITDGIRKVDTNHIIFVEGNWFANDFTGLTPPWDDNLVYSPHKYWSTNDQKSIQWVLDIREQYDVPIFFGESGENSNVWFRDAVKLLEEHKIGWAWWPMKKIESIVGPLSAPKSAAYQVLLDYWEGRASKPDAAYAKSALMNMALGHRMENCVYHKDVIDALFRQVYSDEAIPYTLQDIPGVVYPSDFDMGILNSAYYDTEVANYAVSTGSYTSWNNGWVYRNDGVDLAETTDNVNTNGYSLGWVSTDEWIQYSVNVAAPAVYEVEVRVASTDTGGKFHFQSGIADISLPANVPNTGAWDNWETVKVSGLVLTPEDDKIRFYVDNAEFNVGSFRFTQKEATTTLATSYLSSFTLNYNTIQLNINKPLEAPLPTLPASFEVKVNGNRVTITDMQLNPSNPRMITFTINTTLRSTDQIIISYTGNQIAATDGTTLNTFSQKLVENRVAIIHSVPGKVEAEDYFFESGILLENTTDNGGGQNIGYLDKGDYSDYYINVSQPGIYNVDYRTAAYSETGAVKLEIIEPGGIASFLHQVSFASTGGWQNWATTRERLYLTAGQHHLRMTIMEPLFNMNWFEFSYHSTGLNDRPKESVNIRVFPNPTEGILFVECNLSDKFNGEILVFDLMGHKVYSKPLYSAGLFRETLQLNNLIPGSYSILVRSEDGEILVRKVVIIGD
ncbi:MAG: carbohydrate-binding protein [Bacteroidales bacterium]|nr:carbohydrate-binding protein [Bacteroidales bacterium]